MSIKVPEQLPEGEFPARFAYLKDIGPGQWGERWQQGFHVQADGAVLEYTAVTTQNLGPSSTAGQWFKELLGRKLEPGEEWKTLADLEKALVGKPCTIKAEENDRGYVNVVAVKARVESEPSTELTDQPVRKARLSAEETEPF